MIWLLDGLLVSGLLWISWCTVTSPDLYRAVIWFIVLGLFMALCWARLAAPDLALAEAALGAGVTGALLLEAYRTLQRTERHSARLWMFAPALLSTILLGGLVMVVAQLETTPAALSEQVFAQLPNSGVSNPVTAVLLNFRAYDTLLETLVLLLALLAVWVVYQDPMNTSRRETAAPLSSPLADGLVHMLTAPAILIGTYLLWAGAHAPGGAFQAGAVLAAVGVLLCLTDRLRPVAQTPPWLLFLLSIGPTLFSLLAFATSAFAPAPLALPPAWAGQLIMTIEIGLSVSIAVILTLLFSASPGLQKVSS